MEGEGKVGFSACSTLQGTAWPLQEKLYMQLCEVMQGSASGFRIRLYSSCVDIAFLLQEGCCVYGEGE